MPDRTLPHPVLHRFRPRALASGFAVAAAFTGVTLAASCSHRPPPGTVAVVDHVPPDACVAFYGPGPCREHGHTVVGSTDAVVGPPPASWRGAVR